VTFVTVNIDHSSEGNADGASSACLPTRNNVLHGNAHLEGNRELSMILPPSALTSESRATTLALFRVEMVTAGMSVKYFID